MSEDIAAVPVIDKKCLSAYKAMPGPLQDVARELEKDLCRGAQGIILVHYNLGSRLAEILANEATYGSSAVQQLADYLNIDGGANFLYSLRDWVNEFDKDFVKVWSIRPMANRKFLNMGHWMQLRKVKDRKDQEKLLNRTLKYSWSANDLEKEIKAGIKTKNARGLGAGRPPSRPSSAIAGLQKILGLTTQLVNYETVAEKSIFGVIDEMPADDINDTLLKKLQQTRETVAKVEQEANVMVTRIDQNIVRVERILDEKPGATDETDEDEKKEPEKPAKKSASGKATSNGHAGKKNKKKKHKKTTAESAETT